MSIVKIGCCGFPRSRFKYYSDFHIVELQNTFYELPTIEWCKKLRSEAPVDFEFTIKAWQVITHPSTSPTWRRMRVKPKGSLENYGYLKPTRENIDAFNQVLELAHVFKSRFIILQTPESMIYSDESVKWVSEFFKEIESITQKRIVVGWEPRGEWSRRESVLEKILREYGILHVTDLFRRKPLYILDGLIYTRLHGIGPGEVNYKYKYSVSDFEKLSSILSEFDFREAYVLFNNIYMYQDALSFRKYLVEKTSYIIY
ncbi:MAG: DUF72 domain-containing protein [Desulfurococcaceae archaeon]